MRALNQEVAPEAKTEESSLPALGRSAFKSPYAEYEPWLERCYVFPPNFDLLAGTPSYLVFGGTGSGKTALFQMVLNHLAPAREPDRPPSHLVVNWEPLPFEPELADSAAATYQVEEVLRFCADQLLAYLARWPDGFGALPPDAQETLAWFVRRYLGDEAEDRAHAHAVETGEAGSVILQELLTREQNREWLARARPTRAISEFVKALRQLGVKTVYILLGPDAVDESEAMKKSLRALLSSLPLFENPCFVYKIILPEALQEALKDTGAVLRRRVNVYFLRWSGEQLASMVLKRAAAAVGKPLAALTEICQDPNLLAWLENTGASAPRGWIEAATPLVAGYLDQGRALSTREWRRVRAQAPPLLRFDEGDGSINVGWRRIDNVTDVPYIMLRHLWEHREQICSKEELYYNAYLPEAYRDTSRQELLHFSKDYDHLVENAILRLRKQIEPDPSSPVYIVTVRGKGYKLEHAW